MKIFGQYFDVVETLIALNVLLFFISLFAPNFTISNFGLIPSLVLERPWTLITSMFLHDPFFFPHIFANMFTLFFFGMYLERLIGEKKFLEVYFLGGIFGGILFVLLSQPYSIAIGASGAIFAIGGTLAVLRPNLQVIVFPLPTPMPLWIAIILGFLFLSFIPGVAWEGHLGGLILGLMYGYHLRKKEPLHGHLYGSYDNVYYREV